MAIDNLILKSLPNEPGIYKFFDESNQIIYVGKAKNIRKRVYSYFTSQKGKDRKTKRLVNQIKSVEFSVVSTESDAFLLENNLIKEHKPKYNVLLKDGKTYPYIVITKERFPRIHHTRNRNLNYGEYFGPYPSVRVQKAVVELLQKLFKFRTCKLKLSETNISQGKFKVCLEYHISNCFGPCEDLYSESDYNADIQMARNVLKGKIKLVKDHFKRKIQNYSDELEFEKAQKFQERLNDLESYHSKSMVSNISDIEIHAFTIVHGIKKTFGNYIHLHEGAIIKTRNVELKNPLELDDQALIEVFLNEVISTKNEHEESIESIITNIENIGDINGIQVIQPKTGDKKGILNLSIKNALEYKSSIEQVDIPDPNLRKLETLREELHLGKIPYHIECFDNSNFQGSNPVASMVCFKNGKPAKKEYRHYNIKTVEGPNDFDSMKEIVQRRYSRLINEKLQLPDLVVIDGGKGQLSSAYQALKQLNLEIPVIGIAKKLEELYKPGDPYPLMVSKKSEGLKLIQHLRNEAHRFAITHHRNQRSKRVSKSILDEIEGIGPKTKDILLKELKSVKRIKEASESEIIQLLGKSKGAKIYQGIKKASD